MELKTDLLNMVLSKLARPKALLLLEFDTKDQVLFKIVQLGFVSFPSSELSHC